MYYRNANCAVVVYDITQSASLEKARSWIRELQRQADPSIIIALCGNKSDLSARRQVSQEEAKKYAEEEGLMWGETSAKSGEGVQDIFTEIGKLSNAQYLSDTTISFVRSRSQEAAQDGTPICEGRWWTNSCRGPYGCGSQQAGQCSKRPGRAMQLLISTPTTPFCFSLRFSPLLFTRFLRCNLHPSMCSRFHFTRHAFIGQLLFPSSYKTPNA